MKTAYFLRFAFFKSDMFLLFFIARIVLKRKQFSSVDQEIRGKILQSCSKVYKLVSQSRLATSYFHACQGERGGSVVECRTPEREVRGSRPTAAVLCP